MPFLWALSRSCVVVGLMSGGLVSSEVLLGRSYVVTPLSIKYFPYMALLPDTWPQMSTFTSHCALGGFKVVVGVYLADIGCFNGHGRPLLSALLRHTIEMAIFRYLYLMFST